MQVPGEPKRARRGKGALVDVLIVAGGLALTALILYLTLGRAVSRQMPAIRLEMSGRGVPAQAVVVQTRDNRVLLNGRPEIEFLLEVRPERSSPFQAKVFKDVPFSDIHKCAPGTVLKVLYDPLDPKVVAIIDFEPRNDK